MTALIPDTTRPKKPHEKDGVEYHFVTKQQFDADALNNKYVRFRAAVVSLVLYQGHVFHVKVTRTLGLCRFIEHGEYKENQYGTSIEAIRSVQAKNKMCVVDVQPEVGVAVVASSWLRPGVTSDLPPPLLVSELCRPCGGCGRQSSSPT